MSYKEGIGENGRIPASKLVSVGGKHKLFAPAAKSYLKMKAVAANNGITFKLASSYRLCGDIGDYTQRSCDTGFTQYCAYEKYKAGVGNLAANPTTSKGCTSKHGFGLAIDLSGSKAQKWVVANGVKYGWVWTGKNFSQVEPWHFEYFEAKDNFYKPDKSINKKSKAKIKQFILPVLITAAFITAAYTLFHFTRPPKA